jgi:hypothetical protein
VVSAWKLFTPGEYAAGRAAAGPLAGIASITATPSRAAVRVVVGFRITSVP